MVGIPTFVTRFGGRALLHLQKATPTLLTYAGVAGVVATAVVAARAGAKSERAGLVSDFKDACERAGTTDESRGGALFRTYRMYGKEFAKIYAPTLIVGGLTVACVVSGHSVLSARNAGLMAAYKALDEGFKNYRKNVEDEYGGEAERRIFVKAKEKVDDDPKKRAQHGVSTYARFFDETSKEWSKTPEYNLLLLKSRQAWANDLLQARGHLFLNEVYDMLGIPRSQQGAVVGWTISKDGDNFVDFGIYDIDNVNARSFVNGTERSILLDFNVDGVIYDRI